MNLLPSALALAHNGWHVFPVNTATKAPITANGFKAATRDSATIESWWYAHPEAGIGVACEPTGLFVVDVDVSSGLRIPQEAFLRFNLPLTLVVHTPSGGFHLYYRGVGPSTVSKLAQGVDTRGNGGYVLAPPTPGYRVDQQAPITVLPPSLLAELSTSQGQPLEVKDILQGPTEGTRHRSLFRYACRLRAKDFPIEEAHFILAALADICDPPYPHDKTSDIVEWVWLRYPPGTSKDG